MTETLLGRSSELAWVRDLLAAIEGAPILFVTGERGIGKSSFLRRCAADYNGSMSRNMRHLVVIDDLDLAGEREIVRLRARAGGRTPSLVVASLQTSSVTRSAIAVEVNAWLSNGAQMRALPPLHEIDVNALVWNLTARRQASLDPATVREIITAAEGNPRFVEELVDEALQSPVPPPLIPRSAKAMVGAEKARLPIDVFEVLATAGTIGRCFCVAWLDELYPGRKRLVAEALQAGCDAGLFAERAEAPDEFVAVHGAIAKALAASLVLPYRVLLHDRIADLLIRLQVAAPHDRLVAEHLTAAGRTGEAKAWLTAVAARLAAESDLSAAIDLYERAAHLSERGSDEHLSLLRKSIELAHRIDSTTRSISLREQLLASRSDDESPPTEMLELFFDYAVSARWTDAERMVARLSAFSGSDPDDCRARATTSWAIYLAQAGDYEGARHALERVRPLPTAERARVLYLLATAVVGARSNTLEETLALVDRAVGAATAAALGGLALIGEMFATDIATALGDVCAARERADRADRLALSVPAGSGQPRARAVRRAQLAVLAGEVTAARDIVRSILPIPEMGHTFELYSRGLGAFVAMRAGDWDLMQAFFNAALLDVEITRWDAEACGLLVLGFSEIMVARGLTERLRKAVTGFVGRNIVDPYLWIQIAMARYGDLSDVEGARRQILERQHGTDRAMTDAALAMFDAHVMQRTGRRMRSKHAAHRAATLYAALQWPLFEARALELAGDTQSATAKYQSCGAQADVLRLRGRVRKRQRAPFSARLTLREREVAALVARGQSNKEIAHALGVSVETVHHHVTASLSKLGLRSRWQIRTEHLSWANGPTAVGVSSSAEQT